MRRIDMRRVFDGNFDGVEAPALELFEQLRAVVGERRSEEESIDAYSHSKTEASGSRQRVNSRFERASNSRVGTKRGRRVAGVWLFGRSGIVTTERVTRTGRPCTL